MNNAEIGFIMCESRNLIVTKYRKMAKFGVTDHVDIERHFAKILTEAILQKIFAGFALSLWDQKCYPLDRNSAFGQIFETKSRFKRMTERFRPFSIMFLVNFGFRPPVFVNSLLSTLRTKRL